jgi:putative DNA primase/helicase
MNRTELLSHFQVVRQDSQDNYFAHCPAHPDANASLHITFDDGKGKVLLKCFAGCPTQAICDGAGIKISDLFFNDKPKRKYTRYGLTVIEYAMAKRLNVGNLASWHVTDGRRKARSGREYNGVMIRYLDGHDKHVATRWRMALDKGDGGNDLRFVWDKGNRPVLYGLWRRGEWDGTYCILVEGESDCHSLWSAGFPALGFPGAGNYDPKRDNGWISGFKTAYVIIEPDIGGKNLFRRLRDGGLTNLRVMLLDTLHKDASSLWMAATSPEQFVTGIQDAMSRATTIDQFGKPEKWKWAEMVDQPVVFRDDQRKKTSPENGSENTNKGRPRADYLGLVKAFSETLKSEDGSYVIRWWRDAWYRHKGSKYVHITDNDVENLCMEFLQDSQVCDDFAVQASKSALSSLVAGIRSNRYLGLPSSYPNHRWLSTGEDAGQWRPMQNMVVDIEEGAKYAHWLAGHEAEASEDEWAPFVRPLTSDLLTTVSHDDIPYEPNAKCPRWQKFLDQVTDGNADLVRHIQEVAGYLLVDDSRFNLFFIINGVAGSGKTTFLRVLSRMIGLDNICSIPLLDLDGAFVTWPLTEKLVNMVEELQSQDSNFKILLVEDRFKNMVSGGVISVQRKGKDVVMARSMARHIFACNVLPKFFDKSDGTWDRMCIIPFNHKFRGQTNEILNYHEALCEELPGIYQWALAGLGRLRERGKFEMPECCQLAKALHRESCDMASRFIREEIFPDANGEVEVKYVYGGYRHYLADMGIAPRGQPTFCEEVYRVWGIRAQPRSSADRTRVFKGLRTTWGPHKAQEQTEKYDSAKLVIDMSDMPKDSPF